MSIRSHTDIIFCPVTNKPSLPFGARLLVAPAGGGQAQLSLSPQAVEAPPGPLGPAGGPRGRGREATRGRAGRGGAGQRSGGRTWRGAAGAVAGSHTPSCARSPPAGLGLPRQQSHLLVSCQSIHLLVMPSLPDAGQATLPHGAGSGPARSAVDAPGSAPEAGCGCALVPKASSTPPKAAALASTCQEQAAIF